MIDLTRRRASFFYLVVWYAILEGVAFSIFEVVSRAPAKSVMIGFALFLCAAIAFSLIQRNNVPYAGTTKYPKRFGLAWFIFSLLCIVASAYCLVAFHVIPHGRVLGFGIVGIFCSVLAGFTAYLAVSARQHKRG